MLITRYYDYGWAKVPEPAQEEVKDLEAALSELFSPDYAPVLFRVRLRVNTMRFRAKVRRSCYAKGRVGMRELKKRNRRDSQWPAAKYRIAKLPKHGPRGRARQLMLARSRRIYGE